MKTLRLFQRHSLLSQQRIPFLRMPAARAFSVNVDPSSIRINRFNSGLCINPHPAKKAKGGEDAASVTENIIALADGVGGWSESGVDPALFSRSLCTNIDERI